MRAGMHVAGDGRERRRRGRLGAGGAAIGAADAPRSGRGRGATPLVTPHLAPRLTARALVIASQRTHASDSPRVERSINSELGVTVQLL